MGAGITKLIADPKNKAVCAAVFKKYDQDKSGCLDHNEFDAFVEDLLIGLAKSDPDLRVADLDSSFFNKETTLAEMLRESESKGFSDAFKTKLAALRRVIVEALKKAFPKGMDMDMFSSFDWSSIQDFAKNAIDADRTDAAEKKQKEAERVQQKNAMEAKQREEAAAKKKEDTILVMSKLDGLYLCGGTKVLVGTEHLCDPIIFFQLEKGACINIHLELNTYRGSTPESPVAAISSATFDGECFTIRAERADFNCGNGAKPVVEDSWVVKIDVSLVVSGKAKVEPGKCFVPRVTVTSHTKHETVVYRANQANNKGLNEGETYCRAFKRVGTEWQSWSQYGDEFCKYGLEKKYLKSYLP